MLLKLILVSGQLIYLKVRLTQIMIFHISECLKVMVCSAENLS